MALYFHLKKGKEQMHDTLFESQGSALKGVLIILGEIFKTWPGLDFRMKSTLKQALGVAYVILNMLW